MKASIILSLLPFIFDSTIAGSLRGIRNLSEQIMIEGGNCASNATEYCHKKFGECFDLDDDKFYCACKEGYEGDGYWNCKDMNECLPPNGVSPCPPEEAGGYCVNTFRHDPDPEIAAFQGFKCGCNPFNGFADGPNKDIHGPTTCVDVDECSDSDLNDCDVNADCINTVGSYVCECKETFIGDGKVCVQFPSTSPSDMPSTSPSDVPSSVPSLTPSEFPSDSPSDIPSAPRTRSGSSRRKGPPPPTPTSPPTYYDECLECMPTPEYYYECNDC